MNKETFITSLVISVAVVFGFYLLMPAKNNNERPIPQENLGAVPGNSIEGKYFTVGGIELAYVKQSYTATTTRVCLFKNPFPNSTSTLLNFTANASNSVAGANAFDLATSTTANGYASATSTTALIQNHPVAANVIDGVAWYPTAVGAGGKYIITPRATLTWTRNSTSTGSGTDNFTGTCQATFMRMR